MIDEIVYHGSCYDNLTKLKPFVSAHGSPMVYLTTNIVVATIYTVRIVEQFFIENKLSTPQNCYQFYPYGFDKVSGKLKLDEYYPNAFKDTYNNRKGYIYCCQKPKNSSNPTNIKCALTTNEPVEILDCIKISDVGQQLLHYQDEGLLKINFFDNMPFERKQYLERIIQNEIDETNSDSNGALTFLKSKFPHLF